MNPEKLTDKQKETWGKPIKDSKYVRDFCADCGEEMRVTSETVILDNFCNFCEPRPVERRTICNLSHLKDYDAIDIDSGFDDTYYKDTFGKTVDKNILFPDDCG